MYLLWDLAHRVAGICLPVFFVEIGVWVAGTILCASIPNTWHRVWPLEGTQITLKWIEILWFFVVGFPFS